MIFPELIIINVVVPIIICSRGRVYANEDQINKAIEILNALTSEKNSIINQFRKMGTGNDNAASSQSLNRVKNTVL